MMITVITKMCLFSNDKTINMMITVITKMCHLTEYDIGVIYGMSEDYKANKEQCNKLYDMLEEGEIKDDPDYEYD